MRLFCGLAAALLVSAQVYEFGEASPIVQLTDDNFEALMSSDTSSVWVVEYYADWCVGFGCTMRALRVRTTLRRCTHAHPHTRRMLPRRCSAGAATASSSPRATARRRITCAASSSSARSTRRAAPRRPSPMACRATRRSSCICQRSALHRHYIHTQIYLSIYPSIHPCIPPSLPPSLSLCIYVYMYVCIHVRIYICMYVCTYIIYIYTYIYIHIYIYIQKYHSMSPGYVICLSSVWCASAKVKEHLRAQCVCVHKRA